MSTVRAKFQCDSVEQFENGQTAKLSAVYGEDGENADFTEATPCGSLEINISEDVPASDFFEPGKEYYLDFSLAE